MSCWRALLLACSLLGMFGCTPQPESQTDDQKDPFFQLGRRLVTERDFKGAVDAFEKALELNPRSVMAHYELGLLYETRINEPAIALYHYKQVMKLQPSGHPAEIVIARIKGCEQEIAKNVALVQVDPAVMAELERLKEENRRLQRDLETMRALATGTVTVYTNAPVPLPPSFVRTPVATNEVRRIESALKPSPTEPARPTGTPRPGIGYSTNYSFRNPPTTGRPAGTGGILQNLAPRSKPTRAHSVRERETFSSIARSYGVSVTVLRGANPGTSPERLRVGQVIQIPAR